MQRSTRAGFTLIEVSISMVLTTVLLGLFFMTTQTASTAVDTGVTVAELDARVQRALVRVCDALAGSSSDLTTPQAVAPFSSATVDFQRGQGVDVKGEPVFGPVERLVLEYDEADDGKDDDGDGLVDEGRLVWIESPGAAGERRVVLCNDVREYLAGETFDGKDENKNGLIDERGFALDFVGGAVTVRLTLETRGPKGQVLTSTAQRTVAFRNPSD